MIATISNKTKKHNDHKTLYRIGRFISMNNNHNKHMIILLMIIKQKILSAKLELTVGKHFTITKIEIVSQ